MSQKIIIELEFEDGVEPLCYTKDGKVDAECISLLIREVCDRIPPEIGDGQGITLTVRQLKALRALEVFPAFDHLFNYEPVKGRGNNADVLTFTITSTDT